MRTLIVDDVELAREAIRLRLQDEEDVEVVGEAGSGPDAVSAIARLAPDLLFLDIHMPGLDGFQVLDAIRTGRMPSIVFVTAHDKYAVKAFDAHALHFLLKPIDDEQFAEALRRARQEQADTEARELAGRRLLELLTSRARDASATADRPSSTNAYLTRFAVKDRDGFLLVKAEEVDWIESAGNYVELHVGQRSYLTRMILTELEEKLDPASFARISRSTIVNMARLQRLRALWHGDFQVLLTDGTKLRMSRRYRKRLMP